MKPFMRAQLERNVQRLSELDFLLSREDIMKDMTQFMALSREHAEVVARLSEGRYLARCSCNGGTYHLHWDAATFRLTPEGLTFLAQVLEDLLAQGNDEGAVWLGSVGLRFREGEGWGLLRLLRQGLLPGKEPPRALLRHLN